MPIPSQITKEKIKEEKDKDLYLIIKKSKYSIRNYSRYKSYESKDWNEQKEEAKSNIKPEIIFYTESEEIAKDLYEKAYLKPDPQYIYYLMKAKKERR